MFYVDYLKCWEVNNKMLVYFFLPFLYVKDIDIKAHLGGEKVFQKEKYVDALNQYHYGFM